MVRIIGWLLLIAGLAAAAFGAVAFLGDQQEGMPLLVGGGVVALVGLILGAVGGGKSQAATGAQTVHHHHHNHDDRYGYDHDHDRYRDHDDDDERREQAAEEDAGGGDFGGGDDGGGGGDDE